MWIIIFSIIALCVFTTAEASSVNPVLDEYRNVCSYSDEGTSNVFKSSNFKHPILSEKFSTKYSIDNGLEFRFSRFDGSRFETPEVVNILPKGDELWSGSLTGIVKILSTYHGVYGGILSMVPALIFDAYDKYPPKFSAMIFENYRVIEYGTGDMADYCFNLGKCQEDIVYTKDGVISHVVSIYGENDSFVRVIYYANVSIDYCSKDKEKNKKVTEQTSKKGTD